MYLLQRQSGIHFNKLPWALKSTLSLMGHAVTTIDHQVAEPASSGSKEAKHVHNARLQMRFEITGLRAEAQGLLTVVLNREGQFLEQMHD